MNVYSKRSEENLQQCHPDFQRLFREVLKKYDHSIIQGHRTEEEQNLAFDTGRSKLPWPKSGHNKKPSLAVDAIPYPINWSTSKENMYRYYHFIGYVQGMADKLGIKIRVGADWDNDRDFTDQTFNDLPHFEISE